MSETCFAKLPIDEFIDQTASSAPVPGGGGIAGLTAATAAALVEMVANLTIGKKGYEAVEEQMKDIQTKAAALHQRCLDGIDEDGKAFAGVIKACRLPKDTPDRTAILQKSYKDAAEIPFHLGQDIFTILELANQVVEAGNSWVISDGVIAAMNARAAIRSAFYSVRINLKFIKDEAYVKTMNEQLLAIEEKAAALEEAIERKYSER